MKRLFIILFVGLFVNCCQIKGQYVFSVDKWMEYVEEMASEMEDDARMEALYAELSYLTDHPVDLNVVTAEQLRKLPFLSDTHIESILAYRKRYGYMATVYELKAIEDLDFQTIELLLPFVYIGTKKVDKRPFTVDNLLKHGNNELQIRYDPLLQQKKGYRSQPDSVLDKNPNRSYLGEPFYQSLRYSYTFDERLQFGLVAEKDAGEPFWNKNHKGYDFYSFHLLLKDMRWLKSLALGDYKVSFGQGLVISNEFTPSRNAIVAQAERRTYGFRRHFSTNESDFFRGAAATARWGKVDFSFFYSYRKVDGNRVDSNTVSSIKTDGLHRLARERQMQQILPMQTFGGNIRYATPHARFGLTALSYSFGNYQLNPDPKPYNLFFFRGRSNTNLSVDYLLSNRYLKFFGETAISANTAPATLNALQFTPTSGFTFLLLHRYYDKKYQAYYGDAFSQNSTVQNEQGFYLALQFTPFAYWKLSTYADFFRFPWLRYGVDAPSSGNEYMAQIDYTQLKNVSFYLRYKYKQKEKNATMPNKASAAIIPNKQRRLRLQSQYKIHVFTCKSAVDGVLYDQESRRSTGYMLAQSIGWKPGSSPFQADIYASYFQTDDYNARLSSYEKNILYAFNTAQLYGKGARLSTTLRWDLPVHLSLFAKLAYTRYADRDRIGTALEEIEGNQKTDLSLLLRWRI